MSVAWLVSIRKRHLQQDVAIVVADLDVTMRDIAALQDCGAHQASGIHDRLATSIVQIGKIGPFAIFDDLRLVAILRWYIGIDRPSRKSQHQSRLALARNLQQVYPVLDDHETVKIVQFMVHC